MLRVLHVGLGVHIYITQHGHQPLNGPTRRAWDAPAIMHMDNTNLHMVTQLMVTQYLVTQTHRNGGPIPAAAP